MQAVTGVFTARSSAEAALARLRLCLPPDRLNFLSPDAGESEIAKVPTTGDMSPMGGVLGGALGGAVGLGLGASLIVPGLGAVTAAGGLAVALLGIGGAVAGGAALHAADNVGSEGLPADELFYYKDALHKGRTVIIAIVQNEEEGRQAREVLHESGAESVDAAQHSWTVGLKSSEELVYSP